MKLFLTTSLLAILIAVAQPALAFDFEPVETLINGNISNETNILNTAFQIISFTLAITGAFAVLFLIIGGFRYITSAGNESQVEAAKLTVTYSIIGLVIIILAYVIAATVNTVLG